MALSLKAPVLEQARGIVLPGLPRKYCITESLSETTNSVIYLGFDLETEQQIAVKECKYGDDFVREVTASAKIFSGADNAHIVPILDSYADQNYLIMPFLEGGSLWDLRKTEDTITPEKVFAITAQIGKALERVHAVGLVHNDLKSGNVLLASAEGLSHYSTSVALLTDFGSSFGSDIEPGWGAGTIEYMAPEKLRDSAPPTPLADIYSLGLLIHELLTDTLLYHASRKLSQREQNKLHLRQRAEPVPPHEKIPDKVLKVIRTACETDPPKRYQNVPEMVNDLEKAVYSA